MSSDTVSLEVAFVRLPPDTEDSDQQSVIWSEIDEQHLPVRVRRRLEGNGFRCGIAGTPLPSSLREVLDRNKGSSPIARRGLCAGS